MTNTPLWPYVLIEAALHGDGFAPDVPGSGGGDRLAFRSMIDFAYAARLEKPAAAKGR